MGESESSLHEYRHRQAGMMPMILGVTAVFVMWLIFAAGFGYATVAGIAGATLAAVFLSSMTIEIAAGQVSWTFGPGLLRKSVPVADVTDVEITRTRWWEGWGLRYTRRGWLYNVSGLDAVIVRLKSGKQLLLGTDDPEGLAQALMMTKTSRDPAP